MSNRTQKFVFTTIMVVLVAIVMVFGGASATAYASQAALPGDALYPVKTSLELTQVVLAGDAFNRAQLHLRFAQRRMDEITDLLEQGRYSDVEVAANEFELYIQKAMDAVQVVSAADPVRGAELNDQVTRALFDYALALKSVLSSAPEMVKSSVEKALFASQSGTGEEIELIGVVVSISDTVIQLDDQIITINELTEIKHLIAIGDIVKVHAFMTQDGTMLAREIELAGDDDVAEGDEDRNENDDDHGNENDDDHGNDNDDDHGNENDDDDGNDNDDDHGNENDDDDGNENDDDHGNENDDDHGNENDDDHGNENDDDHGNDNDDDDDGNENDDDSENDNGDDSENDNGDEDDGNENGDDDGNDNEDHDDGNDNEDNDNEEEKDD